MLSPVDLEAYIFSRKAGAGSGDGGGDAALARPGPARCVFEWEQKRGATVALIGRRARDAQMRGPGARLGRRKIRHRRSFFFLLFARNFCQLAAKKGRGDAVTHPRSGHRRRHQAS